MDILAEAVAAHNAGLCVFPPAEDGTKSPMGAWKAAQTTRSSLADIKRWYGPRKGVGVVCGAVSGDLEALDFDDLATYEGFIRLARETGLGDLVERIEAGYLEMTPSDGRHWLYRSGGISGNKKLARRLKFDKEKAHPNDNVKALIETRGERGFVIVAPSCGPVHPSSKPYIRLRGGFDTIPSITADEREDFFDLARSFDQMPKDITADKRYESPSGYGDRPGDEYNRRADWRELLEKHGWRLVYEQEAVQYWRRPGKDIGISATVNYGGGGLLYVFSTSTVFEEEKSYSLFAAYSTLGHAGDFKTAARALPSEGFGSGQAPAFEAEGVNTAEFHDTDLGNARRLVAIHGEDIRYSHAWKTWLIWDGRRWARDETGAINRCAKNTVQSIYNEAANITDESRTARAKHALKSEADARLTAMVSLARSELTIPVRPNDLDTDPWLLNVLNGTVDLRTGELRPHRREDHLTKLAPVEYDADATCPVWDGFLNRIMDGNETLIRFLQRAVGYSLTGDTREQVILIPYGTGDNGKTTMLKTIQVALGDYAAKTPTATLLVKREGAIPNDVARLKGARFVYASEAEQGKRLAEALVKEMTGGEPVAARFMHAEWFEFTPEFKIWLATNHKPVIRGNDKAIWDRIRLIPFDVSIPETEQDKTLDKKLLTELPGILAWAVRGCLDWQTDGLGAPEEVTQATQGYREEMDVLGNFFEDRCVEMAASGVTTKELHAAYSEWCQLNGETPQGKQAFGTSLTARGFTPTRIGAKQARGWSGLGLVER
jgi:putative DNA primase/helicase